MRSHQISTGPETTSDDLALNAIQEAVEAGRIVTYKGSVERFWGARVLWLKRCEFHHPTDPWRDCCHRQQAVVGVRVDETQEAELRHVAAFHLITPDVDRVVREHAPRDWFLRGAWPSCACGYAPKDNRALNAHWAELGIAWFDDHGRLEWTVVASA